MILDKSKTHVERAQAVKAAKLAARKAADQAAANTNGKGNSK